jgi:hypothetical protein
LILLSSVAAKTKALREKKRRAWRDSEGVNFQELLCVLWDKRFSQNTAGERRGS